MADLLAPTLLAAVRISPYYTRITWENNAAYSRIYFEARALPSGPWIQINSVQTAAGVAAEVYDHFGLDGATGYEIRIYAYSSAAGSSDTSATKTIEPWWTVPAIQTDLTAAYVLSGTTALDRHELSWTNHETDTGEYTWQYVHRWTSPEETYTQVNRLVRSPVDGAADSYVDTSPPVDRAIRYKMHVSNGAGSPYYLSAFSNLLYTTPLPPTQVQLGWLNGTTLRGKWASPSKIADKWDVQFSAGGGDWVPLPQTTTKTVDFAGTVGATSRIRVRSVSPDGAKVSAWVKSSLVSAHRAPAAPLVAESGPQDATEGIRVEWLHQPLDGTPQTWWSLRHRLLGSTTWTTSTPTQGEATAALIPAGTYANGATIEVGVQTRGSSPEWSPWSPWRVIRLRPRPQVTITAPAAGAVLASRDLTVKWSVPGSQLGWSVRVLAADGSVAAARPSTPSTASRAWTTFDDLLDDGSAYTVEVTVTTTDGTSAPGVVAVSVVLQRPGVPTLSVVAQDSLGILQATVGATAGDVPTTAIEVLVSSDGGVTWRSVGTVDAPGGMVTDWTPPLWTDCLVKARALSDIPSRRETEPVAVRVESRDCWVNYGPGWATAVRGGPSTWRDRVGRDKETAAAGGRTLVFRAAHPLPLVADVTVLLHPTVGSSDPAAWQEALEYDGPVVFRDARGHRVLCDIRPADRDLRNRFEQQLDFTIIENPGE